MRGCIPLNDDQKVHEAMESQLRGLLSHALETNLDYH